MAIRILSPANSFVQFDNTERITSCNYPDINLCLPVYAADDVYFQFVIATDTVEEADALCSLTNDAFSIGIVNDCSESFLLEFLDQPERYRLSNLQVLYNWSNGLPLFDSVISIGECFLIKVIIDGNPYCSNCFQRIGTDCFTSVIEYGNEDNAFGFFYCNGTAVSDEVDCEPMFVTFTNQSTLTIPYTAAMLAKYGNVPTLKVWIYEGTDLVNMSVYQSFNTYPPTQIYIDLGGPATGVLKIS